MAKKKKKPDFSRPKEIKNTEEMDLELEATEIISLPDDEEDDPEKKDNEDSEIEEVVYGMAKKQYAGAPLVVIAGRPNVGKSTLFNRFMQRRLAIVDPTPGVTRDPVEGVAMFNKKPVRLVDTGGYKLQRDIGTMEAELDELVVERSIEMIEKADLVILVYLILDPADLRKEEQGDRNGYQSQDQRDESCSVFLHSASPPCIPSAMI